MPTAYFWYLSYHLVLQLSVDCWILSRMNYLASFVDRSNLNLPLSYSKTLSLPWKHGKSIPEIIVISTKDIISSTCSLRARNPFTISDLNLRKYLERGPPITSTYSLVSLNSLSKFILPPGEFESINPKSMCTTCPLLSSKILPLWRSLICII